MLWTVLLVLLPCLVFGPTLWVRWVMHLYRKEIPGMPGTGGELAEHLVQRFGLDVVVETSDQGDHYDPANRAVRLTPENYEGRCLTAVAVAAHEVGHALQHHAGDTNLERRTKLAPVVIALAQASTVAISAAPVLGLLMRHPVPFSLLVAIGIGGLLARVLLHLVTLPTEWDASFGKALPVLTAGDYIAPGEEAAVRRILRAAALTYVAAALADVLNLARWAALLLRR